MEITEEELFDGTCVIVQKGDNLRSVPESHQDLITPELEDWWRDPVAAVRRIADRAAVRSMAEWFRSMADHGDWRLELHRASHGHSRAGFWFSAPGRRGAEIAPPARKQKLTHLPPDLSAYYCLVGYVDWMGFGAAGGLSGPEGHAPLTTYAYEYHGDAIDPNRASIFGWSPCGDMLIYTDDGRGGWVYHGTGKIHLLGSIQETLDWVYSELLADRCPEYDHGWGR